MIGPAGGAAPLQYKLRRPPAPQCSLALPLHGKLQSEFEAAVPPFDMTFPQSYITNRVIRIAETGEKKSMPGVTLKTQLTAFLAIFDTSVDKVPRIAVIHAILDSHVRRIGIAGRRERTCRDIVPDL
jgi:hypothetical protein